MGKKQDVLTELLASLGALGAHRRPGFQDLRGTALDAEAMAVFQDLGGQSRTIPTRAGKWALALIEIDPPSLIETDPLSL